MKCNSCGVDVTPGAVYCHKCGARQEGNAASSDSVPPNSAATKSHSPAATGGDTFQQAMNPSARNRDDSEAALWEGNYSAKAMIGSWLLGIVATVLLLAGGIFLNTMFPGIALLVAAGLILLLWIALGLQLLYRKWSVRYQLTNQRFIHRRGILKQVTDRIETIDMDDITFEQGIVQRMLGVGTIRITSSDRTHPELRLIGIEDVQRIANLIDSARRKERVRRGIHIEAV